ncbi:MAG: phosphatidate cytidylyltransferase [Clostridia bacterium]|nr:phosphatidate cytidylyltransferase [Clostridia bacterium]
MKDLPLRAAVAVVLLSLLGLVLWLGGVFQAVILGVFTVLAVFEMNAVFKAKGLKPFIIPHIVFGGGMFLLAYFCPQFFRGSAALAVITALFAALFAIAFERAVNPKRSNDDLTAALAMLVFPVALFAFFALVGFAKDDHSRIAIICVFAGVAMADNTAYMVGSLIGKHKLCPAISPKKSVEGAIAGLIGGALGGVISFLLQKLWGFNVSILTHILVCFFAGAIGQIGDLFASTF